MPDSDTVTPADNAAPALCACGKDPVTCSRTSCSAKLPKADPAPAAATTPETTTTPSTASAGDPKADLASILAGLPKDKLPAIVDMFARLGAAPTSAPVADAAGGAVKADTGKPMLSLIPTSALMGEAAVLAFGAQKYSRNNWRKGMLWSRLVDAMLRHVLAWGDGQDIDPETGLSHLAHARACLGFLMEYQAKGLGEDDRYKAPAA